MKQTGRKRLMGGPAIPLAMVLAFAGLAPVGCSDGGGSEQQLLGSDEQRWDSSGGNPFHATHSYLTEYAINELQYKYPDVDTYRDDLLAGANFEIHDLPFTNDANAEEIRQAIGGNNWGCEHPEYVWYYARHWYSMGNKHWAYWFLGLLLHYVEDAGVPGHAFRVVHQNKPWNWDNFEVQSTYKWDPSYSSMNRADPRFVNPSDYVRFSEKWTISDFQESYPGSAYRRTFFNVTPSEAGAKERLFLRRRAGRTSLAVKWALQSAVTHWQ